jgi:hypothetical protein
MASAAIILGFQSILENAGQNGGIKIGNRSFENMSQFKYFGKTVTNLNFIQEEIKRRQFW